MSKPTMFTKTGPTKAEWDELIRMTEVYGVGGGMPGSATEPNGVIPYGRGPTSIGLEIVAAFRRRHAARKGWRTRRAMKEARK